MVHRLYDRRRGLQHGAILASAWHAKIPACRTDYEEQNFVSIFLCGLLGFGVEGLKLEEEKCR